MKDTRFCKDQTIRIRGELVDFNKPLTMGILNLTPDSFYTGSRVSAGQNLLEKARKMLEEGAEILDLGAYSTRPGANEVSQEEELERLIRGIREVRKEFPEAILSVDTFRSTVAREAVHAGADIVNDVGCGFLDTEMFSTVAALKVPYILMHNRGTPQRMKELANYTDVVDEVALELSGRIRELRHLGVADIVLDPGFGFAKTAEHNFEILNRLDELKLFNCPLVVGVSRKSMVWKTLNVNPEDALHGTTALHMQALLKGANILRVHDVGPAKQAIAMYLKLQENRKQSSLS